MNLGVLRKTTRDALGLLLLLLAAFLFFEVVFVRIINEMSRDVGGDLLKLGFVRQILKLVLGGDLGENLTTTGIMTIGFASALPFAFTWTFLLTTCSRVISGEIDRGTADLLLTLPVSRTSVYLTTTFVWAAMSLPLALAPLVGIALGDWISPLRERVNFAALAPLVWNLYAFLLAIGGIAMCCSAVFVRRGAAVGWVLALLLASFMITFFAGVSPTMQKIAFLSLLEYYRPLPVARSGNVPWNHMAVLVGVFVVSGGAGLAYFRRRDIPAA
ncbi:MAG: ABC transporter permease subunit [Phycisphaerae bacterium]